MEPLVLNDKSVLPTDDLIFSIIGKNSEHWVHLMSGLREKHPDTEGQWNYYNDGKSWLFKMVRKKKTLFWIGIQEDTFRVTFYFGDKAEQMLESSDLPESIVEEFRSGKHYGKIRAITLKILKKSDVGNVLKLVEIKTKI